MISILKEWLDTLDQFEWFLVFFYLLHYQINHFSYSENFFCLFVFSLLFIISLDVPSVWIHLSSLLCYFIDFYSLICNVYCFWIFVIIFVIFSFLSKKLLFFLRFHQNHNYHLLKLWFHFRFYWHLSNFRNLTIFF